MTAKERLEKLDVCVYMQPWWLNIVAGDSWDVLFAERGGNIQGVWVYVTQKKITEKLLQFLFFLNIMELSSFIQRIKSEIKNIALS